METLIKRAKKKDPDAFTELMQSQMQNMYRTARAILMNDEDSADAIQETILACWEKLKDLKEDKYFRTWMTRILINRCYEIIRANQRMVCMEELPEGITEADTPLSFPEVSDTQGDITVSVAQCLLDENNIRLAFYVDGYGLDNSMEPELEYLNILLDGKPIYNYDWEFYSGIDWTDNREPVMADGSPVQENAKGEIIPNYQTANGKMEIDLNMSPVDENGKSISALNGREITVFLQNFGEHAGTWTLKWTLGGADTTVEVKLNETLGNSGATVTAVKVSPISIHVYYDFAKRETMDSGVDENGNTIESADFAEPPRFVGLKMKDGTVYTRILDGGTYGYENGDASTYIAKVGISQVIDPKDVQSLLFLKDNDVVASEHKITEKECYVVDIN
ncbi:MAG: sigma-70 family RNA polymerase sigma factor [Roseburia sp.]|nr:sigma-70 family RNA polymerase sigma factor [Roseburia sp.]MCM1277838.1 sigma-70 family RNA polymerase sigma factor [Robinsoniella sp.]